MEKQPWQQYGSLQKNISRKSKLMMMFYRVAPAATTHKLFETGKKKKTREEKTS
jgi:hypothetical protein